MPYHVIDDWRGGLDLRRLSTAAAPTTLRRLDNGHISEGGEIEKRKALVAIADAAGTVGLACVAGQLTVWGTGASPLPVDTPLAYQNLDPGGGKTITGIEDWDVFDGLAYVVANVSDGSLAHFYNGALVSGALGRHIRTFGEKIYSVDGKDLNFCATGNPTSWVGVGSGTINLSTRDADSVDLSALEVYYDQLAVSSSRTTQFWQMNSDPLANQFVQLLRATGTESAHSMLQYGGGDVLYLAASGIRSLQSRNSSQAASVSDIGSPIDPVMRALRLSDPTAYRDALAVIEQGSGRWWLHIGPEIYVLSYFPAPKVSAWSRYLPTLGALNMCHAELSVAIRGTDDQIYVYGGSGYDTYDDTSVVAVTPYLHMEKPATRKTFIGFDIAALGVWKVEINFDPDRETDETAWETLGVFNGTTYHRPDNEVIGNSTHVALRLTSVGTGPARVANLALHYEEDEAA